MRRALPCLVALAASLAACSDDPGASGDRGSAEQPPPQQEHTAPAPHTAIPREPRALAGRLEETHAALAAAVKRWRTDGDLGAHPPPREVTLWALHQQRIHLLLTSRPALAQRVLERLPAKPAAHLRATFVARRGLRKITPTTPGRY